MNIEVGSKVEAIFPPTNITTATNTLPLRKKNRLFPLRLPPPSHTHTTAGALKTPIIYIPRLRIRFFTVKWWQWEYIFFISWNAKSFSSHFFFRLLLSYLSSRTLFVRALELSYVLLLDLSTNSDIYNSYKENYTVHMYMCPRTRWKVLYMVNKGGMLFLAFK